MKGDYATMISLQGAIKFSGGGHVNHPMLEEPCPCEDYCASDGLLKLIERDFGSLAKLQESFPRRPSPCRARAGAGV